MELSVPCARGTAEAAKGRGRAEACPGDRMESANPTVRPLPCAPAERQAADDRRHCDCSRAIGLHLGRQSRGRGKSSAVRSSGLWTARVVAAHSRCVAIQIQIKAARGSNKQPTDQKRQSTEDIKSIVQE